MTKRVIDKGNDVFELLCGECGKVSMTFNVGVFYGKEGYIYSGVTHECALPMKIMPKIIELLSQDKIAELHEYVQHWVPMEEGLDGYCPECDKVYCGDHISTKMEFDDGFYDCTYGTCPKGHKRIIDD
jgi:hypothetical protein